MPTFLGTLSLGGPSIDAIAAASIPEDPSSPDRTPVPAPVVPNNRHNNIVLSNIAYGFTKPCVLDIKLGAQLWDDAASLEKRARLDKVSDATTSRSLGLRVAGMKVYKGTGATLSVGIKDGYKVYDKHYGRDFTAENVIITIKEYLTSTLSPNQVKIVVERFLERVSEIRKVLENQESRMYSASLLFAYEGDSNAFEDALKQEETKAKKAAPSEAEEDDEDDDEVDDEKIKKIEDVKLIDFAHAAWTPGLGPDENALQGVRSTEKLLNEILQS